MDKELKDIRTEWLPLGRELGIPNRILKEIDVNHQGDVKRKASEMVRAWLDSTPHAGWQQLIEALRELDHHTLASQIIEAKCTT